MRARMEWMIVVAFVAAGLACGIACAQQGENERMQPGGPQGGMGLQPGMAPHGRGGDPLMEDLFPPELVMQNQKAIGLKDDQQKAIRSELQKSMGKFTDLQWQQSAEQESLQALVKKERPDVKEVLAQLDKVLLIEAEMKRLQMGLLVTIKSTLTPEQAEQLRAMKRTVQARMGELRGGEGREGRMDGRGASRKELPASPAREPAAPAPER